MKAVAADQNTIDGHGERVMVDGMDISRYQKNPVLLFQHDGWSVPVGTAKNLTKADGKLYFSPEFDDDGEMGSTLKEKYEKGVMKGFSVGFKTVETSEEPSMLLPGQMKETVTKSILYEISCVSLPANENALVEEMKSYLRQPAPLKKKSLTPSNSDQMKLVTKALGLAENATEQEIIDRFKSLQDEKQSLTKEVGGLKKNNTDLVDSLKTLETRVAEMEDRTKKERASILVKSALDAGKFSATEEESYLKLAEADYDTVKSILDAKKPYTPITAQLAVGSEGFKEKSAQRTDWGFTEWQKKDPNGLLQMKTLAPEQYKELLKTLKS